MDPMPRSGARLVAATAAALAACASPAAAAPGACARLPGHTVRRTATMRLVSVRYRSIFRRGNTQDVGRRLVACVRASGRTRELARTFETYSYPGAPRGDALETGGVVLGPDAGRFIVVRTDWANLTGDYQESYIRVVDALSGRRFTIWHELMDAKRPGVGPPRLLLLGADGRVAGIYANPAAGASPAAGSGLYADPSAGAYGEPAPGQAEVVAFDARGRRRVLDTAPSSSLPLPSLTLRGATVTWIDRGQPRSATIG